MNSMYSSSYPTSRSFTRLENTSKSNNACRIHHQSLTLSPLSSYQKMKKIRKQTFKREEAIEKLLDGLSLLHPTQMGKFLKGLDKVH